jgi:Uma2 family endonuclease
MTIITTVPRPSIAPSKVPGTPEEERGVMRGVSWNLYDQLTDAIGERSSVRVAFDGKDLEIMVVGPVHEGVRELLDMFISLVAEVLDRDFHQLGATTWKRAEAGRGLESDVSYCFDPEKVAICRSAHSRGLNDGAVFPIPDLMAEVDISPPKVDRDAIYSKLRPPEVWRFSDGAVSIERLGADGKYVVADASQFLYFRPEEVTHWLRDADSMPRPAWMRAVREWARAELRVRAGI